MQKLFGILFSGIALVACQETITELPNDRIIPKEKFIPLIVDLQVLESYYQRVYNRPNAYRNSLDSSSVLVFNSYSTSKSDFDRSLSYYMADLNEIYTIYEAALDSLNFRINDRTY